MTEVKRDRYGKPLIIPPGGKPGGKLVAYNRASSFGDALDDRYFLEKYLQRMAVKGLASRPDLYLAATVTPLENKSKLNQLVEAAITAAGGGVKASIGTSLHSLTEAMDRGEDLPVVPAEYRDDLAAYEAATSVFEHVSIERFLVCDALQVAGTPDRVTKNVVPLNFDDGFSLVPALRIGDLKTGSSNGFLGQHCVQLAIYAHSDYYDPGTGERTPIEGVDQNWGVIFHAPAGEGRCDLYAVDLQAGWEAALLAADVRAYRKRKGLAVRVAPIQAAPGLAAMQDIQVSAIEGEAA